MNTIKTWEQLLNERIGDGQITTNDDVRLAMLDHIDALTEALKVAQHDLFVKRELLFGAETERDALQAKLSAIETQEPAFYLSEQGQLSVTLGFAERNFTGQRLIKLYTSPVAPAQPVCHPANVTSDAIGGGTAWIDLSATKTTQPVNELVEACKQCGGKGVVPDGILTHSEGGVEYSEPIQCVRDCPTCHAKAAQPLTKEQAEKVSEVLMRYRHEVPLGHQPHMIDLKADEAIEIMKGVRT